MWVCLCGFAAISSAAPQLKLSTSTIGPVFVTAGQNGAAQTVTASNIGDGSLALTLSSNVTWIAPTLSGSASIQMALNTASLAPGAYTGVVTVSDPAAIDAPQTIVVVVQIGSGVPDSLDLYLPPGGSASSSFVAGSQFNVAVTPPVGGPTLSVSLNGAGSFAHALSVSAGSGGSFQFNTSYTYVVGATAAKTVTESDYTGSFTVTGSPSASDNKKVSVTEHVTTLPIAVWSSAKIIGVVGAGKASGAVAFSNAGMGTLTISAATPAATATWLTAAVQGSVVTLSADPTGMTPGTYQATVSVASNARNSPSTVNVEFDVRAAGPPLTYFGGVLDNALFKPGDPLAPGGIAAVFGEQFTAMAPVLAQQLPLSTTMDQATVYVNNQAAPLFYVSPGQIDFQIPYATQAGTALVRVDQNGQRGNSVSVQIQPSVPRLLQLGNGYAIALQTDNTFPMPVTSGIPSRPAKAGVDTLVFYALGFGQTNPAASDGQAAPAGQVSPAHVVFTVSSLPGAGISTTPAYAGLSPGSVGLYQINVTVPPDAPSSDAVEVYLVIGSNVYSNSVNIAVQ